MLFDRSRFQKPKAVAKQHDWYAISDARLTIGQCADINDPKARRRPSELSAVSRFARTPLDETGCIHALALV
jgi:hypothetical protein